MNKILYTSPSLSLHNNFIKKHIFLVLDPYHWSYITFNSTFGIRCKVLHPNTFIKELTSHLSALIRTHNFDFQHRFLMYVYDYVYDQIFIYLEFSKYEWTWCCGGLWVNRLPRTTRPPGLWWRTSMQRWAPEVVEAGDKRQAVPGRTTWLFQSRFNRLKDWSLLSSAGPSNSNIHQDPCLVELCPPHSKIFPNQVEWHF